MKSFLMIYCEYDPNNYTGHYTHKFKAENMEQAKEIGLKHVKERCYPTLKIEIQINEVVESSSHRVYDLAKDKYL